MIVKIQNETFEFPDHESAFGFLLERGRKVGITYSEKARAHEAALAENITIWVDDSDTVGLDFDYLCRNCGKRHWAAEYDVLSHLLSGVAWQLACGWSEVRMPWHPTPKRDRESIYGVTA